ncbi:MAG: LytTR family DNA-binding domain-containing protein, partial [Bacteroidota bacterium]|nr:LytTR family DNA-binding domain-containing protein [Bacteroidota bacterium]
LTGILIPLSLVRLIDINPWMLMLQGAISGLLLCSISILLEFVTRYTRLTGFSSVQRFFNHVALYSLAIVCWLGTEYLLFYLVFPLELFHTLTFVIPFKIVVGCLILTIIFQFYQKNQITDSTELQESTEEEDQPPEQSPAIESTTRLDQTDTVTVKTGANIHLIQVSDLMYLQAEGDYVILYTADTRFIKEETMKHLEAQLPTTFIRIHRSCIVNTSHISRIELYEKQHYRITLKSGQQLKVSASGYKLLKENLHL